MKKMLLVVALVVFLFVGFVAAQTVTPVSFNSVYNVKAEEGNTVWEDACHRVNSGNGNLGIGAITIIPNSDNTYPSGQNNINPFWQSDVETSIRIEDNMTGFNLSYIYNGEQRPEGIQFVLDTPMILNDSLICFYVRWQIKTSYVDSKLSYKVLFHCTVDGQPATLVSENSFSVVNESVEVEYSLPAGASFISFQVLPQVDNIYDLIPNLLGAKVYDTFSKQYFDLGDAQLRYSVKEMRGIWVYLSQSTTFKVKGNPIQAATITLREGWNAVSGTWQGSFIHDPSNIVSAVYCWNQTSWYYPMDNWVPAYNGAWVYALERNIIGLGDYPSGPGGGLGKVAVFEPPAPPTWDAVSQSKIIDQWEITGPEEFEIIAENGGFILKGIKESYPRYEFKFTHEFGDFVPDSVRFFVSATIEDNPDPLVNVTVYTNGENYSRSNDFKFWDGEGINFVSSLISSDNPQSFSIGVELPGWYPGEDRPQYEIVVKDVEWLVDGKWLPIEMSVTAVEDNNFAQPEKFSLAQNYPNPFNPVTTISYSVSKNSNVTLTVYNTMGQEVAALVDGRQNAGGYEVQFDGSGLASGIYFYRLQAGDQVELKKMILQK